MVKKIFGLLCISLLFSSTSLAADSWFNWSPPDTTPEVEMEEEILSPEELSLKDILEKTQANQKKIKDMYAETTTTITSSMAMPGSTQKGPQTMVQKGKMWTKGEDKSKVEMISPMRQITITNGDQMAIINPETGQKLVQDLAKLREKQGGMAQSSKQMDLEKAMEYFDLSVEQTEKGGYIITGVPREDNKFLSRMEFHIDSVRWVPVKILMYGAEGKLMSRSELEYKEISGIWMPVRNVSDVNSPMGKMSVEMIFENIKVNEGIEDSEFGI
ncbi:outer membrane lipoprotein carrier protein LolA [Candidatus Margulisiibacteriota bacterium]